MTPANLQEVTGFTSLAVAILSLIHAYCGRIWRGHGMGNAICLFSSVLPTFGSAILLLIAVGSLLSLYLHDLLTNAELAGGKNEILLSVLGVITLCWTGILGTDRRRRIVASKLASIPCFGNGSHSPNHQLLNLDKSSLLLFDPKFISSQRSPSSNTIQENNANPSSSETTPERSRGERSVTTTSSRKRKVWEFPCRTAATWIQGRAKKRAWPLNVVRTLKTRGKRFLLIKDSTIQDGAGALLLNPSFVASRHLDKNQIAHVVFKAVQRSTPCALYSWNKKFDGKLFDQFSEIPAIAGMLTGDIRNELERGLSRGEDSNEYDSSKCYMTEIMWAIIVVEVLDYLQYKRRDLPFLSWFVSLPLWVCGEDSSKIEQNIDSVFSSWKAGRICGKLLSKPCDSECCCHRLSRQSFCDCQCQCICNCS